MGFSLVASSKGYSLFVVCGLLIAMTLAIVEHRFESLWASVVEAHGLNSFGS